MRSLARRVCFVSALAAASVLVDGFVADRVAHADAKAKKEIEQKIKEAMENYDLLEYEEARKILNQALTIAKKAKLENDPATAKVHVRLGIVYFAGLQDAESAKLSFLNAVEIDKNVALEKAYSTPEMVKLLDEAKAEAVGSGGGGGTTPTPAGGGGSDVDCASVAGLQHNIVDTAKGGADLSLQVAVGADVEPAKVSIMYRPRGATDFTEAKMTASGCVYTGAIPKGALRGDLVHYYVAAYNAGGKVLASKGSAGSPNIIEVLGGGGGSRSGDDENPLGDDVGEIGGGGGGGSGGDIGTVVAPKGPRKVFLTIAGGSGGGYVTGKTEQERNDVKCCFAPQLVHLAPELGYYINPTTAVSLGARIGFPIGANRMGHATAAPAGLLRIRKMFSTTGSGLQVSGAIGGGVIRNTIKLDAQPVDMDTDIVALGPLLVGAGAGYNASLGAGLALVAELNALAGIPVVKELGQSQLNFGVQFDLNLGLQIGF